jgi:hypothetical protein
VRVLTGEAERGPIASTVIALGSITFLAMTIVSGTDPELLAPVIAILVTVAIWYRMLLAWRSLLMLVVVVMLFIPVKRYTLPTDLPFELEPYRLVVAFVIALWLTSLLIDPRVSLRRSIIRGPLLVYVVAIAGSILANLGRVASLEATVTKSLMFFASFLLVFLFTMSVTRRREDIDVITQILVGGGAIVAVFALIEARTGSNAFNHLNGLPFLEATGKHATIIERGHEQRGARLRVFASSQHPIALGAFFAMLLPLAIYRIRCYVERRWWVAAALLALGAISTLSRTAVLMLVVVIVVFLWLRPTETKRLWPLLIPLVIVTHFALPGALGTLKSSFFPEGGLIAEQKDQSVGHGRLATLGPALEAEFKPNPLLGEGFGTRVTVPDESVPVANAPITDDEWLSVLLETGIVGALSLAWLFVRFIRRAGAEARRDLSPRGWLLASITASVTAYAVGMFTYDSFSFIQVTFLLFVLLGLGCATLDRPWTAAPEDPGAHT